MRTMVVHYGASVDAVPACLWRQFTGHPALESVSLPSSSSEDGLLTNSTSSGITVCGVSEHDTAESPPNKDDGGWGVEKATTASDQRRVEQGVVVDDVKPAGTTAAEVEQLLSYRCDLLSVTVASDDDSGRDSGGRGSIDDSVEAAFERDYRLTSTPVLLRGNITARWPAWRRWTRAGLMARHGHVRVRPSKVPHSRGTEMMRLGDFVRRYMNNAPSALHPPPPPTPRSMAERPLYVFEAIRSREHRALFQDFIDDLPAPIRSWREGLLQGHGLVQLSVGPAGSGTPEHHHGAAVNVLLYGLKRWTLRVPPTSANFVANSSNTVSTAAPLVCMQRGGDALYIPGGWSHTVENVVGSVGVAIQEPVVERRRYA